MASLEQKSTEQEKAKRAAARYAASLIQEGMLVGLGTGSTANYFIEALLERCRSGLKIEAVATSKRSAELAQCEGVLLVDINTLSYLDIDVDGADEITPSKVMIKGGGGALLREKIIASMSREMVVVVDSGKVVDQLGQMPLPVEIIPFGVKWIEAKIERIGYKGKIRQQKDGSIFVTDNGNVIFDVDIDIIDYYEGPEKIEQALKAIPGIVETGLFYGIAGRVIVGHADEQVNIW